MDALVHTSCSLLDERFLRLYASSWSRNPDWMLRASQLFSLGECPKMLKFVNMLPAPQSWAGFLCLLTSCLWRVALVICGSMCWELATAGEEECVWGVGAVVGTHGPAGRSLQATSPQWLVGRLPDGVCELVNKKNCITVTSVSLMRSKPWLLCFESLPTPQPCRSPQ